MLLGQAARYCPPLMLRCRNPFGPPSRRPLAVLAHAFQQEDYSPTAGSLPHPLVPSRASIPLLPHVQVAFQQADYVAWNLWASLNGRELLPFRYQVG